MKGIGGPLCTIAATSFDSVLIFSKNLKKNSPYLPCSCTFLGTVMNTQDDLKDDNLIGESSFNIEGNNNTYYEWLFFLWHAF